ncbi:MAG: peptidoglycan editing factor PgeF [Actinomycetota bacterium]|nr:peptidoglycan editing factor PgeF [Actinomycetota bacterium]
MSCNPELETANRNGIELLQTSNLEEETGIGVFFTNRVGGKSQGPYESLNLSFSVGDSYLDVLANRRTVSQAIDVDIFDWVFAQQVHQSCVWKVSELERGRGGRDFWSALPRSDALVTAEIGIALGVMTADCLPLALVSLKPRAVAMVHAGWRGVRCGIVENALSGLKKIAGCKAKEVLGIVGPHIGPCCLEVDSRIGEMFVTRFGFESVLGGDKDIAKLDLAKACLKELEEEGVREENIYVSEICTCCDPSYFSFRRAGGKTGRQAGFVIIRGS